MTSSDPAEKMNILYISNEYPPETGYGGIATYTRHMARGMAALGHTVHVLCRSESGGDARYDDGGVTVHRVVCGQYPLPKGRFWYPFRMLCYRVISQSLIRLAWAKTVREKYNELRKELSFDVIEYPECGAEGFYLARERNLPLAVRLHTPWTLVRELDRIKEHPLDCMLQSYMEKSTIQRSRSVSSPSLALATLLKDRWHIREPAVFPNPIPIKSYRKRSGKQRWIYTGRIEYRKGVHHLIEAYALVSQTHSPPELLLVGAAVGKMEDGTLYGDYISYLIKRYAAGEKIVHIAGVGHDRIPELLQNSSAAFFPSLWENFPYSCMEAMASGLTVAASDCGGYPEMLEDGVSGLLFTSENTESIASTMRWILENPEQAEKLGKQARIRVRGHFDVSAVSPQEQRFLKQVIRTGHAA
ncbi:MAG: glycosyltransferase family 4 protein [Chitinispirillaceae bacterium]